MKKLIFLFAFAIIAFGIHAADVGPITNAFKSGNVSSIATNMAKEVDIAVPGKSNKGEGKDAIVILTDFFSKNKPTAFNVAHNADKGDTGFLVAKMPTANGEFRVNVTYCVEGNKILIQSIRIE